MNKSYKSENFQNQKYQVSKRIVDIVGSFFILIPSLFLWFFAMFLIFLEDGFPIFVKLPRISEGKIIYVYKLRTMIRGADKIKEKLMPMNERKDGPLFKIKNDPRLLITGKFLRKFRIDETPQVINVFKGELSLVGPRPHEPEEVGEYPEEFKFIQNARMGVTGLSQIRGASSLPFKKELELDSYYLKHQTTSLDIEILLKTILIFIFDPTGV